MGRMMVPRADDFTLGPQTCGFIPGSAGSELLLLLSLISLSCLCLGFDKWKMWSWKRGADFSHQQGRSLV
jgi:hypothetical protein